MKITFFSAHSYDREFFNRCNEKYNFEIEYYASSLDDHIVNVIENSEAICVFVNDKVDKKVIEILSKKGVKYIALRCAGFNNVDLEEARKHNIKVCRVPAYSPEAVAEHALAMFLTLNRKTHKAYNRVRDQNFSLSGLLGFDVHKKTIGVFGTGNIGKAFCKIMSGFGVEILAFDIYENEELKKLGVKYISSEEILKNSHIISLHCPLTPETHYMINEESIKLMKKGVCIINTSRGSLVDTKAVIQGLKSGKIGYLGIDVYEQEEKMFYKNLSSQILEDDDLQMLLSFPNVLVTSHQAFFTNEAMTSIAETTLDNLKQLTANDTIENKAAELV